MALVTYSASYEPRESRTLIATLCYFHTYVPLFPYGGGEQVSMVGRQHTWANSLVEPTYAKLDRVLINFS